MAGDWIKVRVGFEPDAKLFGLARRLGLTYEVAFYKAVQVACWFARYGKQGKLAVSKTILDQFVDCDGFADELVGIGYMREQNNRLTLHGFCAVSATRKGLGKKIRAEILGGASCAACGKTDGLVIDHIIPVVRGGTCERSNLQALCEPCNRSKGRKTMDEFMASRSAA